MVDKRYNMWDYDTKVSIRISVVGVISTDFFSNMIKNYGNKVYTSVDENYS